MLIKGRQKKCTLGKSEQELGTFEKILKNIF
jgi:hypothetical protein